MRPDVIPADTVNSEGADVESENVVRGSSSLLRGVAQL